MRAVDGKFLFCHAVVSLVRYGDYGFDYRALLVAVFVNEVVSLFFYYFKIVIDCVNGARCVHPARAIVKSLINEELSPGRGSVGV